jgi:CelD/BcsL family acetyltransferase involved in cellulose biosynthesis
LTAEREGASAQKAAASPVRDGVDGPRASGGGTAEAGHGTTAPGYWTTAPGHGGGAGAGGGRAEVRVIESWAGMERLRDPWDELVLACGAGPFVSHRWLGAWCKAFEAGSAPRIITVWRDGLLVGAAPLGLTSHRMRHAPLRSVRCLSALANHETPFTRWLIAPGHEDALDEMIERTADRTIGCGMCELQPLADDAMTRALREAARRARRPSTWCVTTTSVTLDLSGGWDAYLNAKSKNFRKKIRRERRALERVPHRWLRGDGGGTEILERAFDVSVGSWKGRAGTAIGSTDEQRSFYMGLWSAFAGEGAMGATLLEIDGRDAGCLISLRWNDTIYGMKIDFVEDFAAYSPGRLMVADFVERSATAGLRRLDMLRRSRFTAEFSDSGYDLGRLRLFPSWNLPALWYSLEERLRPVGRRWRRRWRRARRRRGAHVAEGAGEATSGGGERP